MKQIHKNRVIKVRYIITSPAIQGSHTLAGKPISTLEWLFLIPTPIQNTEMRP